MLRTILYNTRQRLEKEGLPADTYINSRDGSYYWTPEIPVREDAAEFERLYNEAEEETDPERKLALYLDTIHTYSGEFLPAQTRLIWVTQEDRKYRKIFAQCVESAAALLRMNYDGDRKSVV